MNICHTHILFDCEVFKIELFLNYKETLGGFCRTNVNPVTQSLKSLLTELSIQLTNLHSDVDDHQNTSMDYLSFNFRQIDDNVVTVKNDVARTTIFSDTQKNQVLINV